MQRYRAMLIFGLTLASWSVTSSAAAQSNVSAVVQAARKACDEGQYDIGISTLEPVVKETGQMVPQLHLAMCYSKKGWWKKAIQEAETVIDKANIALARPHNPNSTAALEEILGWAKEISEDLKDRIPSLQIIPTGDRATNDRLQVRLDDEVLPPARWETPIPVDPGTHRLQVDLDRRRLKPISISVPEGVTYPYQLIPLEEPLTRGQTLMRVGSGLAASSIALFIPAAIFGKLAIDKKVTSEKDYDCWHFSVDPRPLCNDYGYDVRNKGRDYGNIATVLGVSGAVFAVAGVAMITLGYTDDKPRPQPSKRATLSITPWSIGITGQF